MTETKDFSENSKNILARLLATENLVIEHKKVPTASFDPENRVLTLPIWKKMTGNIYEVLCAHEVGHALYSPLFDEWIDEGLPQSWVNAIEDARIEKLMRRRYPGLSQSFYKGYCELNHDLDIFNIKNRDINSFSLIDRINLHFKCIPLVPFNEKEHEFVSKVEKCETFSEVLQIVRELVEYCEHHEDNKTTEYRVFGDLSSDDEDEDENGIPTYKVEDKDKLDDSKSTNLPSKINGRESEDISENSISSSGKSGGAESEYIPDEAETDIAWNRNQSDLIDESAKDYVYLEFPKIDLQEAVVPWREYHNKIIEEINFIKHSYKNVHNPYGQILNIKNDEYIKTYMEFKRNSIKSVNYLVKEFEMRKSADEYRRTTVAKTGVIDTNSIHSYNWNEDIFKKLSITPGAKNHGLIFFLDWSGSMASCIKNTVKQLYNLIWFCKKVNIPFEVYSFSEYDTWRYPFGERKAVKPKADTISYSDSIRIIELFNNKMNTVQLESQMKLFWALVCNHSLFSYCFNMGGTPLNETILASKQIAENFQKKNKVQKLNLIYLTDGEANCLMMCQPYRDNSLGTFMFHHTQKTKEYYVRDNGRTYKIEKYDPFKQTQMMFSWLSDNLNANIVGFRLITDREFRSFVPHRANVEYEKLQKKWRGHQAMNFKDFGGYDMMYFIRNNSLLGEDTKDIEFEADSSKAQIKKSFMNHMKSKSYNKVILQKFAEYIA